MVDSLSGLLDRDQLNVVPGLHCMTATVKRIAQNYGESKHIINISKLALQNTRMAAKLVLVRNRNLAIYHTC